jgi:hypothetical protein
MANFFTDNEDLQWYLEKGIDWQPIVDSTEFGFELPDGFRDLEEARGFYRDIVTMFGEFVAEEIAPHVAEIERQGVLFADGEASFPPRLEGIFRQIRELDVHGMCLPRELGGVNAPVILHNIQNEMLARAEQSVMTHFTFHGGMATSMFLFSIDEGTTEFDRETLRFSRTRFADEIGEIVRGEAWGCMDITEPDAGSDMAALRTVGEQDADGNWLVSGQKIFVTSGHGKYHFVIARTEKPGDPDDPFAGLGGLSLFLVKTYDDNSDGSRTWHATIDRLEEKLGHHASVTASVHFDRTPAALIGRRGEGFGKTDRPARDDRRCPRRDGHRHSGAACLGHIRCRPPRAGRKGGPTPALCAAGGRDRAQAPGALGEGTPTTRAASHAAAQVPGGRARRRNGPAVRPDPRRQRLHQGLRSRKAAARRHGATDLRGHQPDSSPDGNPGHAERHSQEPASLPATPRPGPMEVGLGA